MVSLGRGWLLVGVVGLAGCFEQPAPASDTGGECTPGAAGCPCSDGVCLEGLECREIGCVDPECVDGTLDCPCLPAGGCDDGLACAGGFCKVPEPGATSTASSSTPGTGDATSSPMDASTGDSVGDGMTSGPATTGLGMTSDDGVVATCGEDNLCPTLGDVCVNGMCESADPYGPCLIGCEAKGICIGDMAGNADACSVPCTDACPILPGWPTAACVAGRCFLLCDIGVSGSCPAPMQCALAQYDSEPPVCMFPHPP